MLAAPAGKVELAGYRNQREQHDHRDDPVNLPVNVRHRAAEEVAEQDHAADPEEAAEDVVAQIATVRHFRSAGHRRAERADDRNEAGEDYGLAAMMLVESVGALEMLALEEARIGPVVEALAHAPADPVAS